MQKRTAWPRADYLIDKPRFKRIGELIKSWARVGLKRVGKSDDQILCLIAKLITLQFWGSPCVNRMLVFTLAAPSFVYVEVVELIWILWERWVRGSQLRIVSKKWFTTWVRRLGARAERRSQLKIVYEEFVYKLGKEAGIMSWITCTRSLKALNISLL